MGRTRSMRLVARRALVWCAAAACAVSGLAGCLQILGVDGTYVAEGGGGTGGTTSTGATGGTGGATGGTTSSGECQSGMSEECYSGPVDTKDVGICHGGTRTCGEDGTWGICEGEQTPQAEDPTTYGDEACDGYGPGETLCAAIFGDPSQQIARVVRANPDGTMVIAGQFSGAISFGQKTLSTHGFTDVFVAKLAPDCTPIWAAQVGGTEDDDVSALVVDSEGNAVVSAWSYGTVSVDAFNVPETAFVVKLDGLTGQASWATSCGGGDQSRPFGLAIDNDGAIIVAGTYSGTLNCGDGDHTAPTGYQLFVSKLKNLDGKPVWTKSWNASQHSEGTAVVVDSSNNIIVGGSFEGSLNFGPAQYTSSGRNSFLLRLTSAGAASSATRLGDTVSQTIKGLALGKVDALFIAGTYQGTISLPGVGTLTNNTSPRGFLVKQLAGGSYEWGWHTGGSKGDSVNSVAVDSQGQLIAGLEFDGDLIVEPLSFPNSGSTGRHDGLVLKLQDDSSLTWAKQLTDAAISSVAVSNDDTIASCGLVTASFSDTIDLGTGPLDPQGDDAFVVRHAP